jgi:hypothetical protein
MEHMGIKGMVNTWKWPLYLCFFWYFDLSPRRQGTSFPGTQPTPAPEREIHITAIQNWRQFKQQSMGIWKIKMGSWHELYIWPSVWWSLPATPDGDGPYMYM